jgi:hypothetical protein
MQDVQAYLEKPGTEAVDCALISKRATAPTSSVFDGRRSSRTSRSGGALLSGAGRPPTHS